MTTGEIMDLLKDHFRLYRSDDPERERFRSALDELMNRPVIEYAPTSDSGIRTLMEMQAWRNAMTGLCLIWPNTPDEAAAHLRKRLHDKLEPEDQEDIRQQLKNAKTWIDRWMGENDVVLKLNAYHRILHYVAQVANSGRAARDWPMLEETHLLAIVFAYNEGYSKAFEGRVFPNPFAESRSQAAAWALGTRDGGEQRQKVQSHESTIPELRLCAFALASAVSSHKTASKAMLKISDDLLKLLEQK